MKQLREVIATASGVRIVEDIGTPYTTGQTVAKVWLFIDLSNIIQRTIDTTFRRYGSKRTERFIQWCNGRQVNTYWREHRPTLYALYCIDNMIFFGGIALTTYAHKISPADELKPTLSMGVTMNHFAAVAAPLIGGLVWMQFGYQVIFFSGAALAFISLVVCQWVDPEGQLEREEKTEVLAVPAI